MIFEAGHGQGAVGQHGIIRAFAADTVLLVTTHAVGTAAAEQQHRGDFQILVGMGVAQLAAHDKRADVFVFFGGEIVTCAAVHALHGRGRTERAEGGTYLAFQIIAVGRAQQGFDVLAAPGSGEHQHIAAAEVGAAHNAA